MDDYPEYAKLTDRCNIVDFVKEVEKYPCLYDQNLSDYTNRILQKNAWTEIATKLDHTVPECRDKWRKIRIAFMRSLKQVKSDHPPSRPYYLSNHLQFIVPFVKYNNDTNNCTSVSSPTTISDDEHFELELIKQENVSESDDEIEREEKTRHPNEHRVFLPNYEEKDKGKHVDTRRIMHKRKTNEVEGISPRKMFLLSILPEIEAMSEQQMRTFRRDVVLSIDNIMNNSKAMD